MIKKIKESFFPYLVGVMLIIFGWYLSILNVGLTRFQTNVLFTKWTGFGLLLILIGAYFPGIFLAVKNRYFKKD